MSEFGLPREARLRQREDIRTILDRGKRERTSLVDVFFMASPVARSRFGLIVPKHRHRIVDRNLLKRRLREIGRLEVLPRIAKETESLDVLVRAGRRAYEADFEALRDDVLRAVEGICSGRG